MSGAETMYGNRKVLGGQLPMMDAKGQILYVIREDLRCEIDANRELTDNTALVDLGLSSMELITLLLALKRRYGVRVDAAVLDRMPATVGDIVRLLPDHSSS